MAVPRFVMAAGEGTLELPAGSGQDAGIWFL
jgi:hypothetical protein